MTASEVWRSGGRNEQNPYRDRLIGKTVIVTLASLMMRFASRLPTPTAWITEVTRRRSIGFDTLDLIEAKVLPD